MVLMHHGLGDAQARHGLTLSRVLGVSGRGPVGPQTARETESARGAWVVGDAALRRGTRARCRREPPLCEDQMLQPGLPKPCMAAKAIMVRVHSLPVAERQAPPQPP